MHSPPSWIAHPDRIPGGLHSQFQAHGEKRQPYETDIRVPLLVRGPGIAEGARSDAIALSIDLAPTLVDMAGGLDGHEDDFDGESLLRRGGAPREDFLIEYHGEHHLRYR